MRVLYISNVNLFKKFGGGLATLAYYNAIYSIFGGNVDLILPEECIANVSNIERSIFGVRKQSRFKAISLLLLGKINRFYKYLKTFLNKYSKRYDLAVINGGLYAGELIHLFKEKNIKVVVIHHNFEKEYHTENKSLIAFNGFCPFLVEKHEKLSYMTADLNLFLTKPDMENFLHNYGQSLAPSFIIGCFEPEESVLPKPASLKEKEIVFAVSGSMNSFQTESGIKDFNINFLPQAKKIFPHMKVILTGRNPSYYVEQLQNKEPSIFQVIPNPKDILSIIKQGSIYLCPTNLGSGLKLRVMDGLRVGLPVLVHSKSARGYECFFDKPYFQVYWNKVTFLKGLKILHKLILSKKINSNEIQLDYLRNFSFRSGTSRLERALRFISQK